MAQLSRPYQFGLLGIILLAAVWLVLLLCRQWKAEPGWVDGTGRLLGAMAIGTAILGLVIYRI